MSDSAERVLAQISTIEPPWPEPPEEPAESQLDRFLGRLVTDEAMESQPPPEYLIDGVLVRDSLAVLYGPSGSGKTFVAIDWQLSVATGSWWQGRKVVKGPVLFVAAEGSGGLGARISAWKHSRTFHGDAGLRIFPEPVNLLDPVASDVVAQAAKRIGAVLVVVDTVARSMPGGDENSAKDIGLVVENADVIRRMSTATVLLVHHTGKDLSAGMRGHSALRGALATSVECKGGEGRLVLTCDKQKDDVEFSPIHLGLVQAGASWVISDRVKDVAELPSGAVDLLRTLVEIADEEGVSTSVWLASASVAVRSFYRWQKRLVEEELAAKSGPASRPRYTPTEVGKRIAEEGGQR